MEKDEAEPSLNSGLWALLILVVISVALLVLKNAPASAEGMPPPPRYVDNAYDCHCIPLDAMRGDCIRFAQSGGGVFVPSAWMFEHRPIDAAWTYYPVYVFAALFALALSIFALVLSILTIALVVKDKNLNIHQKWGYSIGGLLLPIVFLPLYLINKKP